jgi:hypothetical protein
MRCQKTTRDAHGTPQALSNEDKRLHLLVLLVFFYFAAGSFFSLLVLERLREAPVGKTWSMVVSPAV